MVLQTVVWLLCPPDSHGATMSTIEAIGKEEIGTWSPSYIPTEGNARESHTSFEPYT